MTTDVIYVACRHCSPASFPVDRSILHGCVVVTVTCYCGRAYLVYPAKITGRHYDPGKEISHVA